MLKQLPTFIARPDGTGILAEYRPAVSQIAISPALMRQSSIFSVLQRLPSPPSETFEATLTRAVSVAFEVDSKTVQQQFAVPDMDYRGAIFRDVQAIYQMVRYEKGPIQSAISILVERKDPRLRSLLGIKIIRSNNMLY